MFKSSLIKDNNFLIKNVNQNHCCCFSVTSTIVHSGIIVMATWLNSCLQKLSNVLVDGSCFSVVTEKCPLAESRESWCNATVCKWMMTISKPPICSPHKLHNYGNYTNITMVALCLHTGCYNTANVNTFTCQLTLCFHTHIHIHAHTHHHHHHQCKHLLIKARLHV